MRLNMRKIYQERNPTDPIFNRRKILQNLCVKQQELIEYENQLQILDFQKNSNLIEINNQPKVAQTHRRKKHRRRKTKNYKSQIYRQNQAKSERTLGFKQISLANKERVRQTVVKDEDNQMTNYGSSSLRIHGKYSTLQTKPDRSMNKNVKKKLYGSLAAKTSKHNQAKAPKIKEQKQQCFKHQNRIRQFMNRYRSACKMQKSRSTIADQQYAEIQNIVQQIAEQKKEEKGLFCFQQANFKAQRIKLKKTTNQLNSNIRIILKSNTIVRNPIFFKALQNGTILKERYKILQKIGQGLSGFVYKSQDILANRLVAIKAIFNRQQQSQKQYQFYKNFQHKNVVIYYNNFVQNNCRYLVLEYFPFNLASITKNRKLTQFQIKSIFKTLALTLHYFHGIGIAHRDIKLQNVVISQDLQIVKFIDFGLCIDMSTNQNYLSKQFCGTINYMPPQILQKSAYRPKTADLWSLGVLLYKLLFDKFPFRGKDQKQQLLKINKTKLIIPDSIQGAVRGLLTGMLCKNPKIRWTILEVINNQWLN